MRRAQARRIARAQRQALLRRRRLLAAGVIGAALLAPGAAQAHDFLVTQSTDPAPDDVCDTDCTLRDAIDVSNSNSEADVITFAPSVTGPITLTQGELPISEPDDLTITGPGRDALTISGGDNSRIFNVNIVGNGAVSISGLTLTHGHVTGGGDAGAAVFAHGGEDLTLSNLAVTDSTVDDGGGGGIAATGQNHATITGSTVSGNTAEFGGGIETGDGPVRIQDTTISGNHATDTAKYSGGGGLHLGLATVVDHSTISGNTSASQGGGIRAKYGGTITSSTVTGNSAVRDGGGMQLGAAGSVYYVHLTVSDTTVSGNQSRRGAGIEVRQVAKGDRLRIERTTISGNNGGDNSVGGGILFQAGLFAPVELVDSTISGNTATAGAGVGVGSDLNDPVTPADSDGNTPGSIELENSTIAGNAATAHGGGVYLTPYDSDSPGVMNSSSADITSTIVAGNTANGAAEDLDRGDTATTGGFAGAFSLVQAPGDAPLARQQVLTGVDPQLGALGDNGGATATMLPAGTSPVIDQGRSPVKLTVDQRGLARLVDSGIVNPPGGDGTDIGAVELPADQVVLPPLPPPPPTATFGVTVRGNSISPGTPLLPASLLPFDCSVTVVSMSSCGIELRAVKATKVSKKTTVPANALLAEGVATSSAAATSLSVKVKLTGDGKAVMKALPVGVDTVVGATAATGATAALTAKGVVHLLAGPSATLGLGKRKAKLPSTVTKRLDELAKLITDAKTVTCLAYSDKGKGDVALTRKQAKAACSRLVKDGIKAKVTSSGQGHAKPVASNKTKKGRALNRRIVVRFTL